LKREKPKSEPCPVARSLKIVGSHWSLLIVRNAFDGTRRFTDFQRDLKLSKSVLASRLRKLVTDGVLKVVPGEDGSAYHEYELTEKGRGLFHVIVGLRQWGEDYLFSQDEARSVMVERRSGKPVGRLTLRTGAGRDLSPDDVLVKKAEHGGKLRRTIEIDRI
jgi:DNA-binding HxlR family transcriptional regulator